MFTISLMTSSKILPHEVQVLVLGIVLISHLRSLLTAAGLGSLCRTRCRLQTWAGLSCERGLSIAALPPLLPQHRLIQGLVWPGLITAAPALCPSLCSVCRVLQCPGRLQHRPALSAAHTRPETKNANRRKNGKVSPFPLGLAKPGLVLLSLTAFPCVLVQGAATSHSCGHLVNLRHSLFRVFVTMDMSARPSFQNIWNDPVNTNIYRRGLAAGHKKVRQR